MKRLLLLVTMLYPVSAHASQITVFDTSTIFGSQTIAQNEFIGYGPIYFVGGQSGGVVSAFHNGNTYELAANNVSNVNVDTLNIYALWQGITSPTGLLTVNTMMAVDEYGGSGWTLSETVYINNKSVAINTQFSFTSAPDQSFTFDVGNGPFDLQLSLQYVSSPFNGDFGSYVIATLDSSHPVPAPVIGAGLPGLVVALFGWLGWRRRNRHAT
jgi:hypothetical protein